MLTLHFIYPIILSITQQSNFPSQLITILFLCYMSISEVYQICLINLKFFLQSINHNFSVIALSETWLKTVPHSYYFLPGYELIVNNRTGNKAGGGVALYVSRDLNVIPREDLNLSDDSLESLFIEITVPKSKGIIAGVMYKAPSVVHSEFMTSFQMVCSRIAYGSKPCIISGDFNINILNYANPSSQSFIDLLTSH